MKLSEFLDFYNSDDCPLHDDEATRLFTQILKKLDSEDPSPVSESDQFIEYLNADKKAFHNRTLGMKTDVDFLKDKISELDLIKESLDIKTANREKDTFLSYAYNILSSRIEDNLSYLNKLLPDEPLDSGEYFGTLTKDQKLVMLHELGVLDYLTSKDCKYANQKDGTALSVNKIAGILTEFIDSKKTTIQPSLSKLMSSEGTMTKSKIDSAENELMAKNFLKKLGLTKKA